MKVLLVSGIYFPDVGGPASYIPRLANALREKKYEVTVVSLTDNLEIERPFEPWSNLFVERNINKFKRSRQLIGLIRREAIESEFIFVNGLYVEAGLALRGLKRNSTAKIVGDPIWERSKNRNETSLTIDQFATRRINLKNWAYRKLLNFSLSSFDKLTAPSKNLVHNIRNWGVKTEVQVIPNGVYCQELNDSKIEYDVISLSRLVSWKRIDTLIQACEIAGLSLAIAGDGPEKNNLVELGKRSSQKVDFLGQLNREQSIELLRKGIIFALLSTYEGLSFALIEAMMLEKRILVSDAPGNIAVITNQLEGLVARDFSAKSIGLLLTELKLNEESSLKYGKNARMKSRKLFCEERQMEEMIKLITRPRNG